MIYFIKIQSENMKMTWNTKLLMFCMIYISLTAMALQFCKYYPSNSVVLSLLSFLCNHGNLTLKLHQKT